jgi:hypothetical protein
VRSAPPKQFKNFKSQVEAATMKLFSGDKFITFDADRLTAAAQVGRAVVLEQILLGSASFKSGKSAMSGRPSQFVINLAPTASLAGEPSQLHVSLAFSISIKDSALPEVVYATIDAEYLLTYSLVVPPPPEEHRERFFSAFAEMNGVHNAWPYLREFVQSATGRMGMSQVLLPVFRIATTRPAANAPASPPPSATQATTEAPKRRRRRTG